MTHDSADAHAGGQAGSHHGHYIAPVSLLLKVFGILIGLTALTVWTGTADWIPPALHIPVALLIAGVKVYFVAAIFMGLKHDNKVNTLALALGFMFVLIFLTFTLIDVNNRGDLSNVDPLSMSTYEAYAIEDSIRNAQIGPLQVAPSDYVLGADSAGAATVPPPDATLPTDEPEIDAESGLSEPTGDDAR